MYVFHVDFSGCEESANVCVSGSGKGVEEECSMCEIEQQSTRMLFVFRVSCFVIVAGTRECGVCVCVSVHVALLFDAYENENECLLLHYVYILYFKSELILLIPPH